MMARRVLALIVTMQSVFSAPAIAESSVDMQQSVCECVVPAQGENRPVGTVKVTKGQVLTLTLNGYVPVVANASAAIYNGSRIIPGPRSEGNVVLSSGCMVPIGGTGEVSVGTVKGSNRSLCLYAAPNGGGALVGLVGQGAIVNAIPYAAQFIAFSAGVVGIGYSALRASR